MRGAFPCAPVAIRAGRPAGDTTGSSSAGAKRLAAAIPEVLDEAIAAGGSSLRDHRSVDGTLGYFQHSFAVYGREGEPCLQEGLQWTGAPRGSKRPFNLLLSPLPAITPGRA